MPTSNRRWSTSVPPAPTLRFSRPWQQLNGGGAVKDPVRQRVRHVAPAVSDVASDSDSNMSVVRNTRNVRKNVKRMLESNSPPAPSAPPAPRSYSAAAASAPIPTQPARRPVLIGKSTTSALKASKHLDLPKKVFRIGNFDEEYDETNIMAHLKSIDVT